MSDIIYIPKRITRAFIQSHPEWNFVYSSCVHNPKPFGQAAVCIGEPNTFPIPVRWSYCKSNGYFSDSDSNARIEISVALDKIPKDKPIIPIHFIGYGSSRLKDFAPKILNALCFTLSTMEYPSINWT